MAKQKNDLSSQQKKDLDFITKSGYTSKEIKELVDGLQKKDRHTTKKYSIGRNTVRFGVFGDTHIGNINYDPDLMKFYKKITKKEQVDFHLNVGDIVDGWYQNRPSSIFEQNAIGFDRQLEMAIKEFKGIKEPLYFITGNHSYNTFVRGAGVEFGPHFQDKLNKIGQESYYLGNAEGDLVLKGGCNIKLLHPDGGTAYALSYRPQKIIESLSGGEKPNLLFIGHFHKIEQLYYRNIHAFQTGTFMGQTKFMRGKNIPAHKGFWILDVHSNSRGQVDKLVTRLYPAYD